MQFEISYRDGWRVDCLKPEDQLFHHTREAMTKPITHRFFIVQIYARW